MSIRERVEEALIKYLLDQRGLVVYFHLGDPIVKWSDDIPLDSSVRRDSVGPDDYYIIRAEAEDLYQVMMKTIDFNRLALEAVGAWYALPKEDKRDYSFDDSAKLTGQAIRMALTTEDTFPDWAAELAAEREKS
jgi:hypothetical protein